MLKFLAWLVFGVPPFVRGCWVCEVAGLRVRFVGARRYGAARRSPGVGVNRRRSRLCGLADVRVPMSAAASGERGRASVRPKGCPALLKWEVRRSASSAVDFGQRLGAWRGKCLQNAVLGLARGSLWCRLRCRFSRGCCDHEGAGLCGNRAERRNLISVWKALEAEASSVLVVGCESLAAAQAGCIDSCCQFGSQGGVRLGILLWCCKERHVYGLGVGAALPGLSQFRSSLFDKSAPWLRSVSKGRPGRGRGRPGRGRESGFRGGSRAAASGPAAASLARVARAAAACAESTAEDDVGREGGGARRSRRLMGAAVAGAEAEASEPVCEPSTNEASNQDGGANEAADLLAQLAALDSNSDSGDAADKRRREAEGSCGGDAGDDAEAKALLAQMAAMSSESEDEPNEARELLAHLAAACSDSDADGADGEWGSRDFRRQIMDKRRQRIRRRQEISDV